MTKARKDCAQIQRLARCGKADPTQTAANLRDFGGARGEGIWRIRGVFGGKAGHKGVGGAGGGDRRNALILSENQKGPAQLFAVTFWGWPPGAFNAYCWAMYGVV